MANWTSLADLGATLTKLANETGTDYKPKVPANGIGIGVTPQEQVLKFYKEESDKDTLETKPWVRDPHFFHTIHISTLALLKMSIHARSGGAIEIMGMMTGKVFGGELVVLDCYPLPVQGTESRVNPLNEAYEFMLQFLEQKKKQTNRNENIIGWYHSHPGFGCWLSGIDVQTQELNQGFQDPYVAVVIDPERSSKQGFIDIGAFRTYYPEHLTSLETRPQIQLSQTAISSSAKLRDFGHHADKYYSLDVRVFQSEREQQLLNQIDSKFWYKNLMPLPERDQEQETARIQNICTEFSRLKPIPKKNIAPSSSAGAGARRDSKPAKSHDQASKIGAMLNSLAVSEYERLVRTEAGKLKK